MLESQQFQPYSFIDILWGFRRVTLTYVCMKRGNMIKIYMYNFSDVEVGNLCCLTAAGVTWEKQQKDGIIIPAKHWMNE